MDSNLRDPLVSIVLPAYNHARFVEACVKSVTEQTYKNIEVIIVNDGSKDSTQEVVKKLLTKLNDTRIKFVNQERIGPSATINKGVSLSSGELITILNADEIYYPNRIEKLVSTWKETHAEFIFTKLKHIDTEGNHLSSSHPHKKWYDHSLMYLLVEPSIGFALLKANSAVTSSNYFFTRTLYDQLNGFSTYTISHELDFILRTLLFTEPLFVPEELLEYRVYQKTEDNSSQVIDSENDRMRSKYFSLQMNNKSSNTIAPTESNWPNYFFSFLKTNNLENIYKNSISNDLIISHELNNTSPTKPRERSILSLTQTKGEINLITHELSLTGAPALIYDLAHQLRLKQYAPKIYSPRVGPLEGPIKKDKIPLKVLKHANWIEKRNPIGKLISLALAYLEITIHLKGKVILNSIANWSLLIPLYLNPRVNKIYFYLHEDFSPDSIIQNIKVRRIIKHILTSKKANLWFGSTYTGKVWEKLGYTGKVKYFSGFNLLPNNKQVQSTDTPKITFLFIGTFSARKGLAYLFDAFSSLPKLTDKHFDLKIVGVDTQMDDFTLDLIRRVHNYNSVHKNKIYLYPQQNPNELETFYKEADIYISASLSECIPLAMLNAMRHQMPIITTNAGGCSEAVFHEKNGFVVHSRDIFSLQKYILYFLKHPEKIESMGKQSLEIFKISFENSSTIGNFTKEWDQE